MKTFQKFLIEDYNKIIAYHGTHKDNVKDVLERGIIPPSAGFNPNTVSLAAYPDTAFGYVAMSGHGGESGWNDKTVDGKRVSTTPPEDRIVFKVTIPLDWHNKHLEKVMYPHGPMKEYRYNTAIPAKFIRISDKTGR